jgi:elongation factor 1-beta
MGEVILVYKILPESPEDFDKVKQSLEAFKPEKLEEEPIAFGLKAIKLTIIVPDASGAQEELEEKIRAIDGVKDFELLTFSRCL